MKIHLSLLWQASPREGKLKTGNARLKGSSVASGDGKVDGDLFAFPAEGPSRTEWVLEPKNLNPGKDPDIISVLAGDRSFTFFLRDVNPDRPILIPSFGVAVTTAEDLRTYSEILTEIQGENRLTNLKQMAGEPEESWATAARESRKVTCQTWLGLSRDVRIFEVGIRGPMLYSDWIQPRFSGHGYFWEEENYMLPRYGFVAGRGWASSEKVKRRIDEGCLPILHQERIDDDIRYDSTLFTTFEKTPLSKKTLRGTHFRVADGFFVCKQLSEGEQQQFNQMVDEELAKGEEVVLCCRIVAKNTSNSVPRYAFFKTIHPHAVYGNPEPHDFDGATGFSSAKDADKVFGISRLDGKPLGQPEISVLLNPGETVTLEFFLPHRPISRERAATLAKLDLGKHLSACRRFWRARLKGAAHIQVPERRINEMVRAGLLHMDLVTYGIEPDKPLAPGNGTYSPVISELGVTVIYYDTMGLHDMARRCIDYYIARVQKDGFLQTFLGYMLETGVFLWVIGEHFRYTRDTEWLGRIRETIEKSADYILRLRKENQQSGGCGLLGGKVADPEDDEVIFMLNGFAYIGLSRAAECLTAVDKAQGTSLQAAAEAIKQDIRAAYLEKQGKGPVIPLADGTWCPTVAPWLSRDTPTSLFTDGECWWTHGAATLRDDLLGPQYLVYQEVLDPREQAADFLLNSQCELMRSRNASFSQPFLSRHQYAHLFRDEPEAFLKAYYNSTAALVDRETHTFWEHYYHESPHKIGDEVQFLMQTRCMLYLEDGDELHLLRGVPRAWLNNGKRINVAGAATYFGTLSFTVESCAKEGLITAEITCTPDRAPKKIVVRLPHPEGLRAKTVTGGEYEADRERVTITEFPGKASISARF